MREVVIIDAVRSAVGKRNGGLAGKYATELLGDVLTGLLTRNELDPAEIDHVIGGCVSQVGVQAANVTRNSWLAAGLPFEVPAVTVNTQCGSSQEAVTLAHAMVAGGLADIVIACGMELMSKVPLGVAIPTNPDFGFPRAGRYETYFEPTTQFEAAERIAETWNLDRSSLEIFAKSSQDRAQRAWAEERFAKQIIPIDVPVRSGDGEIIETRIFNRDEGPRNTTLEVLATLRPNLPERQAAFHTAGTSSQISDGASAILLMSAERANQLRLPPRARLVDSLLVGSDPVLMLTGPIPATQKLLERSKLHTDQIDLVEINEAFASVVLAWQSETDIDPEKVNVNGGAIALGHPLGATGTLLMTKALYELERGGGRYGLITMCCGGGLGTGSIIERL